MEYVTLANTTVPTLQGAVEFRYNAPCSILQINGIYLINDRRGFFSITEQTRDKYFKPATSILNKRSARGTIKIHSAARVDRSAENERKREKYAKARAARAARAEQRVVHGGYRKNRFNSP